MSDEKPENTAEIIDEIVIDGKEYKHDPGGPRIEVVEAHLISYLDTTFSDTDQIRSSIQGKAVIDDRSLEVISEKDSKGHELEITVYRVAGERETRYLR